MLILASFRHPGCYSPSVIPGVIPAVCTLWLFPLCVPCGYSRCVHPVGYSRCVHSVGYSRCSPMGVIPAVLQGERA